MSEHMPAAGAHKLVIAVMALAFVSMLGVSLWQRLVKPDLVVSARTGGMPESRAAEAANMDEIGQLMTKIQQDPGDVDSILHLAEHFVSDQNWPAAENFLRRAVVAAPARHQALYLLGVVLHNQGKHAEAAACLEQVVGLRDEASVRYSLGVLYAHYLQNPADALVHLRAALLMPGLSADLEKMIREEVASLAAGGPGSAPLK